MIAAVVSTGSTIHGRGIPRFLAHALLACAAVAGCGRGFDRASELKTLRVLAVKKDNPYARPGETVGFEMLWHDGSPKAVDRTVQIAWFAGCENPPGDLYYACFPQLAKVYQGGGASAAKYAGIGPIFHTGISPDIITRRPPPGEGITPYGLAYVFFAACAGKLGQAPATEAEEGGLPIGCFDASGNRLGPADFVVGYTAVYAYDALRNANPIVTGLYLDGRRADEGASLRVARDGTHHLTAGIDRASAEVDPNAKAPNGSPQTEQVWIAWFSDKGNVDKQLRLVNDAQTGWNDDSGTDWDAPSAAGNVEVFAVVHDNRGGVGWARATVVVE